MDAKWFKNQPCIQIIKQISLPNISGFVWRSALLFVLLFFFLYFVPLSIHASVCAVEGRCVCIAHFKLHPKSCSSLSLALISHDLKHIINLAWEAACFFHTHLLLLRFPPSGIKTVGFGFPKAHIASCYRKSESICECLCFDIVELI